MDIYSQLEILGIVLAAAGLGGIIGWEREARHVAAGLRTHMLIASSAAAFVALAQVLSKQYIALFPADTLRIDPIGIFQAIVVGIGFIGGGIIFRDKEGDHVRNLTTAASILLTTGVGIAVALSQFSLAIGLTLLVVFINHIVYKFERRFMDK